MKPTKQTKIEVLKLVIASYQYFADGKGSRETFYKKYVPKEYKEFAICPACSIFDCTICPCNIGGEPCAFSLGYIDLSTKAFKTRHRLAIKRIAELTETLKKLEQ